MNIDIGTEPELRWGKPDPTHDPVLLANFKPRQDDILITSAPKAGTTWMQNILHQLRSAGDPDFDNIDSVVPWLELPRTGRSHVEVLEGYEAMAAPRIFKTHCTYEQTPGTGIVNIVMSSRDPRDCMVSFYHHVMDMTDEARELSGFDGLQTFDDVFELWMTFGAWYRNIASWWPHIHDDRLLWLRYEDMKQDIEPCIDRILGFLDWEISPAQRKAVNEYISFDWMKAHADKFIAKSQGRPMFKPGGFIRKGRIGDHKQQLSAVQEQRILDKATEVLETECLRYLRLPG
jgi:hypothetical protein